MFATFFHRILRIPYTLNVRYERKVPNARETYVFIHGIGDTADVWKRVVNKLPKDVNYIAVDLLGFGDSPKPEWARYNISQQAHAVLKTCAVRGFAGPAIFVGHSLGSLVSIEIGDKFSVFVRQLILCSPPIYDVPDTSKKIIMKNDDVLRMLYRTIARDPKLIIELYRIGQKMGILGESLAVNNNTVNSFIKTLQASIIDQKALDAVTRIKKPITIISGLFDVLIVQKTLRKLQNILPNVTFVSIASGHSIDKYYEKRLLEILKKKGEE